MRTALALISLLAACVPVEIKRSVDGAFAYRVESGIAILRPGAKAPKIHKTLVDKDERFDPIWIDWSPDGQRIAFTGARRDDRQSVCMLDPVTGAVRVLATHGGKKQSLWFPRVSPDGRSVSYVVTEEKQDRIRAELRVVSLKTGAGRIVARRCGILHAWAPDSKSIALVQSGAEWVEDDTLTKGSLVLVDVATGQGKALAPVVFNIFSHLRFSADGGRLFFCAAERLGGKEDFEQVPHGLFVFDFGRKNTAKLSRKDERVFYSAASPSGKQSLYVAAGGRGKRLEGDVIVIDNQGKHSTAGKNEGGLFPFWLDEARVAFASKGSPKRIRACNTDGRDQRDLTARFAGLKVEK